MYHVRLWFVFFLAYWIYMKCRPLSLIRINEPKQNHQRISNHDRTGRYRVCITWVPLKYASTWMNLGWEVVFLCVSCFLSGWTLPSFFVPEIQDLLKHLYKGLSLGHEHLMSSENVPKGGHILAFFFGNPLPLAWKLLQNAVWIGSIQVKPVYILACLCWETNRTRKILVQ